jgi:hypothetical protein
VLDAELLDGHAVNAVGRSHDEAYPAALGHLDTVGLEGEPPGEDFDDDRR